MRLAEAKEEVEEEEDEAGDDDPKDAKEGRGEAAG